jgi:NADPH-dependent curcumin reductase CurA
MSSSYQAVVLAKRPKDNIVPGETFKLVNKPTPKASDLKDGEVIFESIYLSLDPAMRSWLNGEAFMNQADYQLTSQTPEATSHPSRSMR